jgi:hypothetical protein
MLALDRSLGLLEIARTQKGGVGEQSTGTDSSTQKGKGRETDISEGMEAVRLDDVQSVLEECLRGDLCFNGWRNDVFVSPSTKRIVPFAPWLILLASRTLPSLSLQCIICLLQLVEWNP